MTYPTRLKGRGPDHQTCYHCGRTRHVMSQCHAVKHVDGHLITKAMHRMKVKVICGHLFKIYLVLDLNDLKVICHQLFNNYTNSIYSDLFKIYSTITQQGLRIYSNVTLDSNIRVSIYHLNKFSIIVG